MAVPTNAFDTYEAVGNREDLSDVIYDISPTETPFMSNLARVGASNTLHEWQMDTLATQNTGNAAIEGDDHSGAALTPTLRLKNYCQIFRKDIVVTGTEGAMNPAGRGNELDYQIAKVGNELKRDMESIYTQEHEATAGGAGTARNLGGVETWMGDGTLQGQTYAHVSVGTGGANSSLGVTTATGLPDDPPIDDSVPGAATETALKEVIREAWVNGGEPRVIMTGPFNKQAVSGFGGIATLQKDVPGNTQGVIVGAADIYVSDFGVHTVVPNRFNRDRTILVLDMTMWANAELRPMQTVPIAKTGDSDKIMMLTEATLECRNPLASGKIADCTTS